MTDNLDAIAEELQRLRERLQADGETDLSLSDLTKRVAELNLAVEETKYRRASEAAQRIKLDKLKEKDQEDATYWFRRFFTSLSIANGAAFVAVISTLKDANDRNQLAGMVEPQANCFVFGMLCAGIVPAILAISRSAESILVRLIAEVSSIAFAVLSTLFFMFGLFFCLAAVARLAG